MTLISYLMSRSIKRSENRLRTRVDSATSKLVIYSRVGWRRHLSGEVTADNATRALFECSDARKWASCYSQLYTSRRDLSTYFAISWRYFSKIPIGQLFNQKDLSRKLFVILDFEYTKAISMFQRAWSINFWQVLYKPVKPGLIYGIRVYMRLGK